MFAHLYVRGLKLGQILNVLLYHKKLKWVFSCQGVIWGKF